MDDILLIENDILALQRIKVWLSSQFSIKDLGEPSYILRMKIYRDRSKRLFGLLQSTFIDTILTQFSMKNFKKRYLPIDHGIFLSKRNYLTISQEREHMSRIPHALVMESIMYIMTCTISDIAYSLGVVSRYQSDPEENHWKAVKIIFKYLRNIKDQWLVYRESDMKLMGFADSNFQSDHDDSKSMSEFVFLLNDGAVYWKSFDSTPSPT